MKQRRTIKIDEKEVTLKELAVVELLYLCHKTGFAASIPGVDFGQFKKQEAMTLPDSVLSFASDITRDEVILFAPSEIKKLYDAFMEINEVTFSVAKFLGVDKILEDMKSELIKAFISSYSTAGVSKDKNPEGVASGVLVPKEKAASSKGKKS